MAVPASVAGVIGFTLGAILFILIVKEGTKGTLILAGMFFGIYFGVRAFIDWMIIGTGAVSFFAINIFPLSLAICIPWVVFERYIKR